MLYTGVFTIHSHLNQEQRNAGMARRAEWQYPQGVKVHHEVWRASAPEIVTTFECDTYEQILSMQLAWADFFQMNIAPSTTAEEGLKAGARVMSAMKK